MKRWVKTLSGHRCEWKLPSKVIQGNKRKTSNYHSAAKKLLQETYSTIQIFEEVPIHTDTLRTLYLDFYIPSLDLAIEVHGEQHYNFSSHFHGSRRKFLKARANDRDKITWCELNGIFIAILSYKESLSQWKEKIVNYEYDR
tara:strand:+ start:2757 stop:3182 length:426 start_codon:yes stop_codon:yes gene_type:complete